MTGFDAVETVYKGLKGIQALSSLGGIYQFTKPMNIEDEEFIAVNCLTVPETMLQITYVNVNVFVKDIFKGTPNNGRLQDIVDLINSNYPFGSAPDDIQVFKESTAFIQDDDFNRHYVNMRFKVIMLNS